MLWKNCPLVTSEPIDFENRLVEVQDFKKNTNRFLGVCGICLKLTKKTESSQLGTS